MAIEAVVQPGLAVHVELGAGTAVLHPVGYLDISTAGAFTRQANACLACGAHSFEVDASAITFLDPRGLAAVSELQAQVEARGGTLLLTGVPPQVNRLLAVTGRSDLVGVG